MKTNNEVVEEWKSVNGLEEIYEISNKGHVRSIKVDKKGNTYYKYLKPRNGQVDFCKDGKIVKRSYINHLMYEHFGIPTEKGEVWKDTEYEHIKISNLGRVFNTKTAHLLDGENVKVTKMSINAFGLPSYEDEHWKDVENYEGLYQVSDKGRVRNVMTGRMLMQYQTRGYLQVSLYKEGKHKLHRVHRLVAQAFIFNPNEKEFNQVNHRNEDTTDNRADNLEWCNQSYNNTYGTRIKRVGKSVSAAFARRRQERLAKCKTEEERKRVLKALRQAEYKRQRYWEQKNQ